MFSFFTFNDYSLEFQRLWINSLVCVSHKILVALVKYVKYFRCKGLGLETSLWRMCIVKRSDIYQCGIILLSSISSRFVTGKKWNKMNTEQGASTRVSYLHVRQVCYPNLSENILQLFNPAKYVILLHGYCIYLALGLTSFYRLWKKKVILFSFSYLSLFYTD